MLISVAIPCYRSEKNLTPVVEEIKKEFAAREGYDYQIILVNDGSPDHTDEVIRRLCEDDPKIVGVLLSRNYSQSNAKMAALHYVKGDVVVFMDDDGQHPADGIFALVSKIQEGYDVVYAHFPQKKTSKFKIWTSNLYAQFGVMLGTRMKGIKASSFMAYSRFAADELKNYTSPSPSAGGYLLSVTTKFANIDLEQRKRLSGKSGYSLKKLINLAITGLTNFTIVPLRIASYIGSFSAICGFIYGFVLLIRRLLLARVVAGYTSIIVITLILGGLILLSLGLLGEYIGRMYMLLSNKPQFTVREEINVSNEARENSFVLMQ